MKYIHLTIKNAFVVFVMLLGVSSTASATWGLGLGLGLGWGHHTSSVQGQVFKDNNKNGRYDRWTDTGLANIQIKLTDCNGAIHHGTTDSSGCYTIRNVVPGSATVKIVESSLPARAQKVYGTDPKQIRVSRYCTAQAGRVGYVITPVPTLVSGTVYEDSNGNGIKDSNEHGQAGVQVKICYTQQSNNHHGSNHHGSNHHGCHVALGCHFNGVHVGHCL